jgi:hypothetical protein
LEAAAADTLADLARRPSAHAPAPGALCANCQAVLQGAYCHVCGQQADTHKRSILHLAWEAIEGLFHLDGRLARTVPDLFLRPGRLARDYMEGRIARHVPPFRTFLVALLLYVFAAEHATHEATLANERQKEARNARLATPQGRAAESAQMRAEALQERTEDYKEAASDHAGDLNDPAAKPERVQARYARALKAADDRYAIALVRAQRVADNLPPFSKDQAAEAAHVALKAKREHWWTPGLRKATANPEYFWAVLFTWAHRLAVLLLPIVGLTLAGVYRDKRQYYVYDHLLVAMNVLSFVFLANAAALILPPPAVFWALGLAALWTPVNLFQTLRGAYGSGILGAFLKTLVVWFIAVIAFEALLTGLVLFSLTQL